MVLSCQGYTQSQSITVSNSFSHRLKIESIAPDPPDDRFYYKPPVKVTSVEVDAHKKQKVSSSAVVFWLFPKPVSLPQKTVGYRLTLIQSSNLYFSLIHVILLELNHCCAYMQCLCCNGTNLFFHFFGNIVLSYSELPMIIN